MSIPPRQSYRAVKTALGPVSFLTDGERVLSVRLGQALADGGRATPLDRETARQLKEFCAGTRTRFDLPWRLDMPAFTSRVLKRVARIPHGATLSYGEVAAAVGQPKAARAVGQAMGSNPLPLLIPCHRVLAAGGRIGGFGGGLGWKRALLAHEGVTWRE